MLSLRGSASDRGNLISPLSFQSRIKYGAGKHGMTIVPQPTPLFLVPSPSMGEGEDEGGIYSSYNILNKETKPGDSLLHHIEAKVLRRSYRLPYRYNI